MEKDNNQRVADQREVIRDLQQKLSQAQDENEKKSLQLKLDVAQAKLREYENEQANDVSTNTPVTEGKSTWKEQRANDLRQRIKRAMVQRDRSAGGDVRKKWQEGINDMRRQLKKVLAEETPEQTKDFHNTITDGEYSDKLDEDYQQTQAQWDSEVKFGKARGHKAPKLKLGQDTKKGKIVAISYVRFSDTPTYSYKGRDGQVHDAYEEELTEGCMTRKFENMTNREVASYIFNHPHTKFASKMKECDDKEIMKAIRDMKKASEEAPVTNTSAVATTAGANSMYMKRPEPEELKDDYLK